MRTSIACLLLVLVLASCNRSDTPKSSAKVEIYLLADFERVPDKCQIDNRTISLGPALVSNDEIVAYHHRKYEFTILPSAVARFTEDVHFRGFAVTVDRNLVYTGFFRPSYSSSSCDHSVVIDPFIQDNKMRISLGYPSADFYTGDDPRNTSALIEALRAQGKLR
jgi:hypothetical protein